MMNSPKNIFLKKCPNGVEMNQFICSFTGTKKHWENNGKHGTIRKTHVPYGQDNGVASLLTFVLTSLLLSVLISLLKQFLVGRLHCPLAFGAIVKMFQLVHVEMRGEITLKEIEQREHLIRSGHVSQTSKKRMKKNCENQYNTPSYPSLSLYNVVGPPSSIQSSTNMCLVYKLALTFERHKTCNGPCYPCVGLRVYSSSTWTSNKCHSGNI